MGREYFSRVLGCKSAIDQAWVMLCGGINAEEEYAIIDTIPAEEYDLSSCSIFRDHDVQY